MVEYILSSVGSAVELDRRCPHCGGANGRIHSGVRHRRIMDLKAEVVRQRRMRCPRCGTTWTLRAAGVQEGRQRSDRVIGLGVVLYVLGLSYRGVQQVLEYLDCRGSKSSIERDVAAAGEKAMALHQAAPRLRVEVLSVDGTGNAMAGDKGGLLFFVDVGRGKLLRIEPLRETDTAKVRRHVRRVFRQVRAGELRTDEHSVYENVVSAEKHRLCLAHWRKSKGKRASDLCRQAEAEGRPLEVASMRRLLEILRMQPRPSTVPEALTHLVMRYINAHRGLPGKINQLLQHIERTWAKVSDDPADPTNNVTERLIGLTLKIRAKTMRGFKADHKVLAHPYLAAHLRGEGGICDLRKVI